MDEMDLEISQDTGEELTEEEYNEILGLENMDEKGESDPEGSDEQDEMASQEEDDDEEELKHKNKRKKKRKQTEDAGEIPPGEDVLEELGLSERQLKEKLTLEHVKPITVEYHTAGKTDGVTYPDLNGFQGTKEDSSVDAVNQSVSTAGFLRSDRKANANVTTNDKTDEAEDFRVIKDSAYDHSGIDNDIDADRHSFSQGIDVKTYAVNAGQMISEMAMDDIRRSDENFHAGQRQIRYFTAPVLETISVLGAVSTTSAIRDDFGDCAEAAIKATKLMEQGKLTVEDLSLPKRELREILWDVSSGDRRLIARNAGTIGDLFTIRSVLTGDEIEAGKSIKNLPEELAEHIRSKAFFDLREEKTGDVLKAYCRRSRNDVLRNTNPTGMSSHGIKKLLREGDKQGFSQKDKAALRLILKQKKMREARQKINVIRNLKRYARLASRKITEADDNVVAGVTASQRVAVTAMGLAETARLALRTGAFAHRTWTKYGLVGRYVGAGERFVIRKAADGTTFVLKKTTQGIKLAKKAAKETIGSTQVAKVAANATKMAKEAASHSEAVRRFKEAGKSARVIQKTVAVRTAGIAHAASKAKQGARIAFTPFRMIKKAFSKVASFFSGLKAVIAGTFFGIIVLYVVIVILLTGILSIFAIEGEAVMNVILCNDEGYVQDTIDQLDGYFTEEKDEALAIATGTPQNPNVFYGHTISRYGAPLADGSWTDGYKIYYRDMDGNIIENGVNNIKDVIVLAYVMMDGDFDTDTVARDALINDLWKQLNPGVTWEETDIYTAEIGDDTYRYHCDSSSDYDEMDAMRSEGVRFYGSVHSYAGDGCKGDEDDRYCNGHSVKVCYGHKDIKVYITVGFMEDIFEGKTGMDGGTLGFPNGSSYKEYIDAFQERGGWSKDAVEWANALYAAEWYELYGNDPAGGSGFSVADVLTPTEIEELTEQYGSIDGTRTAVSTFALDMVGKIPYYWGGKPASGDYDENHFYSDVKSDGSQYNRTKRGLDCSGFVAFVYWHVLGHPIGASSTGDFTNGRYKKISASELKPGDVGLLRTGYSNGNSVNHIGIFVGRDASGNAVWVHCTGGNTGKTVCGTYNFSVYYSILD